MAGRTQPDIDRAVKVMLAQWLGQGGGFIGIGGGERMMTGRTLVGGGSALDIVMVLHLPIILQFPTVPATIADPVPPREESTTEKGRGASIGDDGDGWDPGRGNGRRGEYDRESDACFVCSAVSCPALSRAIALSGAMNSLTPFYLFLSKDSIWSMRCVLTLSKVHSTSKYAGAAGADQLGSESPRGPACGCLRNRPTEEIPRPPPKVGCHLGSYVTTAVNTEAEQAEVKALQADLDSALTRINISPRPRFHLTDLLL
jgi:hypothetical protein